MAQPVEESWGDVAARCEVGAEDMRLVVEIAAKWKAAEEEARRRRAGKVAKIKAAKEATRRREAAEEQ
jgi:hypothetical protein